MPEETVPTIVIGGEILELTTHKFKKSKRVDNPDKPGKKKTEEHEVTFVGPKLNGLTAAVLVFTALLTEAETKNTGGAEKLSIQLLQERIENATEAGFDEKTGKDDPKAYIDELTTTEKSSRAVSEVDILRQQVELGLELSIIAPGLMNETAWESIKGSDGKPLFKDQDALIQRYMALQTDINRLHVLHEAKLKAKETAANARKKKAQDAAAKVTADAAKAGATQAGTDAPAPAPATEPAH